MSGNLTDTAESSALNHLTGNTASTPTLPLKLALCTAAGSDSAAGTEVTGGSYARQSVAFGASSSGSTVSNSADVVFTTMPAVGGSGVVEWEIWDSAGTPVRWWHGPPTVSRTVTAGDDYRVAAGDLTLALD